MLIVNEVLLTSKHHWRGAPHCKFEYVRRCFKMFTVQDDYTYKRCLKMYQGVSRSLNMCKPSPVFNDFSPACSKKLGPGSEEFGNDQHPKDLLQNGVLQVAAGGPDPACGPFRNLLALSRVTTVYWEEPKTEPKRSQKPGGLDEPCSFERSGGGLTQVLSGKK